MNNLVSSKRTMALKGQRKCVQREMKSNRRDYSIENDNSISDDFSNKRSNSNKKTTSGSIKTVPAETVLKSAKNRKRSTLIGRKKRFSGNESDSVKNSALNYTSASVPTLASNDGDFDYSNIDNECNQSTDSTGYNSGNNSKTSSSEVSSEHSRSDGSIGFGNVLNRKSGKMKGKSMEIVPPCSELEEQEVNLKSSLSDKNSKKMICIKYVDTDGISNHDSGHSSSESIDLDLGSTSDSIEIKLNNNSDDKLIACLAGIDLADLCTEMANEREENNGKNERGFIQIGGESIQNEDEYSANHSKINGNGSEEFVQTVNNTNLCTEELTELNTVASPPNLTYFVYQIPYESTELAIQVGIPSTNDASAAVEVNESISSSMISCQTFELCEVEITNEDGCESGSPVENGRNLMSYHESSVNGAKDISKSVVENQNVAKKSVENFEETPAKTPSKTISKNVLTRRTAKATKNVPGSINSKSSVRRTRRGRPRGSKNLKFTDENLYSSDLFFCDTCPDKIFKSRLGLKKHIGRHLSNEPRQKCALCGHRPRNLENHMRMKHSTERYKCDFCEMSFKSKENRLIHMRTHTGERPYVCSVPSCGMSFRAQATWRKHENRVHRFVKNHRCDDCGRQFHSPYLLEDHVYAFHKGERPYSCNLCGKNFATRHYLRTHKITHGEKVHKCRHCDKMFALADNRRKHERRFHKIK